jgi:hypothetical protein
MTPGITKVALATAHHDPTDKQPRDLKARRQRRHRIHDRAEHRRRR